VYVYLDGAAGQDPFPALDTVAPKLNVDVVDRIPVPTTAVDLTQQFQQAKSKDPDYVIAHLFGPTPALGVKAWKQVGLTKPLIGMVWAYGESDIAAAGDAAEGYYGLQFTAMPEENPQALQFVTRLLEEDRTSGADAGHRPGVLPAWRLQCRRYLPGGDQRG